MNREDRKELSEYARRDGKQLVHVAETLYAVLLVITWIIGIFGGVGGLFAMTQGAAGIVGGLVMLIVTGIVCFLIYIKTVLVTHTAKVMAHTSLATVAILEERYEKSDASAAANVM
jgi:uncharacterized membrane protein